MSELSSADQIFYILLLGGLILASVGGLLYIVMDVLERKQELTRLLIGYKKFDPLDLVHSSINLI